MAYVCALVEWGPLFNGLWAQLTKSMPSVWPDQIDFRCIKLLLCFCFTPLFWLILGTFCTQLYVNSAAINGFSFTAHYLCACLPFTYWPNPKPEPQRRPLAISTQNPKLKPNPGQLNIHKNYHFDRRQISVINTFSLSSSRALTLCLSLSFSLSLGSAVAALIYGIFGNVCCIFHASATRSRRPNPQSSSPGRESPPSAFLMAACKNLQLQHALTAGFNINKKQQQNQHGNVVAVVVVCLLAWCQGILWKQTTIMPHNASNTIPNPPPPPQKKYTPHQQPKSRNPWREREKNPLKMRCVSVLFFLSAWWWLFTNFFFVFV